jgi:hypothetical protein
MVWLVAAGPLAVLVAGAATIWIAFASADGLVAEDYYKQGLGINRVLAREDAARARGISAQVVFSEKRLTVHLQGEKPEALFAHLAHATRAGHDVRLRLAPTAPGVYEADAPDLPAGRWRVVIEDPRATWRIAREAR